MTRRRDTLTASRGFSTSVLVVASSALGLIVQPCIPSAAAAPPGEGSGGVAEAAPPDVRVLVIADRVGFGESFVEALVLRTSAEIHEIQDVSNATPPDASTAFVVVTQDDANVEIVIVVRDGRAWRRSITREEVGEGAMMERAAATAIANLVAAIADEALPPDELLQAAALPWIEVGHDTSVDERRHAAGSSTTDIDRGDSSGNAAPLVDSHPVATSSVGIFLEPMTAWGLGPPQDARRWTGTGAAISTRWMGRRGLVIGGRARVSGMGTSAIAVLRTSIGGQFGGQWALDSGRRRDRGWNLSVVGQLGFEPWRAWLRTSNETTVRSPVYVALHVGPSVGVHWWAARAREEVHLGLRFGADATWATLTRPAFTARIAGSDTFDAANPPVRVGGAEVSVAFEVGWVLRRRTSRGRRPRLRGRPRCS